ncbi:6-phosphogluconate dehydrogenase C-terminal domain-like protein [Meira miltonrushii]|uniref:6-phosphogluconate dehydrogenase C-terminal domain-like protein n=1 Tax=Meira miltonrushii TaxID=1280837 RepID=A0A316VP30_9BASI|nr:6-phosphogluconate dehydrogenase C-terminal domain-like protein [Meira miltonrushii]PWN37881.1 6-phosphogluconate dehydrogenase C-terminal domain-like protein [Meira miltonrushii]
MRFHVVGVGGGTGALLSYHIKRATRLLADSQSLGGIGTDSIGLNGEVLGNLPNPSVLHHLPGPNESGVTLRVQKHNFLKKIGDSNAVTIERDGVARTERGFNVQLTGAFDALGGAFKASSSQTQDSDQAGTSICESIGYPKGSLDALIVATKPQYTASILEPLVGSLTPASTLVLLQNGQGILDEILPRYFPDSKKRPNIIMATSTHRLWSKSRLHAVHAHLGRLDIAVLPGSNVGVDYEKIWTPSTSTEGDLIQRQNDEQADKGGFSKFFKKQQVSLDRSYATVAPDQLVSMYANRSPSPLSPTLNMDAIPSNDNTRTLTETLSVLQSLPLEVTWQPVRRFQLKAIQNLVVSACIDPITALVGCRNGHLFGNRFAEQAMRDVCKETSEVLRLLAERTRENAQKVMNRQQESHDPQSSTINQDFLLGSDELIGNYNLPDHPTLDPSLQSGALLDTVQRAVRMTAPQFSTMYNDLNTNKIRNSSEINYINGYIGRLGRSLGVATPVNDMLVSMIRLKQSKDNSPWKSQSERD